MQRRLSDPPITFQRLPLHQKWQHTTPTSYSLSPRPSASPNEYSFHLLHKVHTRYRRWDSNAETFRARKFNSDTHYDDEDNDDDDEWFGVFEEFVDGAWIFPVFRSFGWMLPAILSSLLLYSGPQAFLMALALPLGQSALSLAFQMISGRKPRNPKPKPKTKTKPHPRYPRNVKLEEEEEEAESEGTRKGTNGYQKWGNDVQVDKDTQDSRRFGGWDELDRQTNFNKGSTRKSAQDAYRPERSKLSRRRKKRETPLLLRLLIALFPFLGSWTKLL